MASGVLAQAAKMVVMWPTPIPSRRGPAAPFSAPPPSSASASTATPPFKISPVSSPRTEHEIYARLYLHHTFKGQYTNQHGVLSTEYNQGFGSMVVNDWVITDGPSRDSKVVAHAKGIHVQAGLDTKNYYVSFNMVFEDGRFKGSTLQVMGTIVEKGEWAIVGGTGELTLARGVIYKPNFNFVQNEGDCIEIDIHCLYTPMERSKGTSWTFEA